MSLVMGYEPVGALQTLAVRAGLAKAQQEQNAIDASAQQNQTNTSARLQEMQLRSQLDGLSDDRKFAYDQVLQDSRMKAGLQMQMTKWQNDQQKLSQALEAIDNWNEGSESEKDDARKQAMMKWGAGVAPQKPVTSKPVGQPIQDKAGNFYQQIFDPTTGAITVQPLSVAGGGDAAGGTPLQGAPKANTQVFRNQTTLRQEFLNDPVYKSLGVLQVQNSIIHAAYNQMADPKNKSRTFIDQAMIMTFNKILDPTSAVREGEYDRTEANTSIINRWKQLSSKWFDKGGVAIPMSVFKEAVELSEAMTKIREQWVQKRYNSYRGIATENGLDPDKVFGDLISSQLGQPAANMNVPDLGNNPSAYSIDQLAQIAGRR